MTYVGIVTDSSCDLPAEIIRAHGIHVVPLMLLFEKESLRDRVDITAEQFIERESAPRPPPTLGKTPGARG